MTKLDLITDFLSKDEPIAVIGVSRNKKKFGRQAYDKLKSLNYTLIPINSKTEKLENETCYDDIESLPDNVKKLIILTPKEHTDTIIEEASKKGIEKIWVQQMCNTENTHALSVSKNISLIDNECIFMFAEPKGIHKFHKVLRKAFGTFPN